MPALDATAQPATSYHGVEERGIAADATIPARSNDATVPIVLATEDASACASASPITVCASSDVAFSDAQTRSLIAAPSCHNSSCSDVEDDGGRAGIGASAFNVTINLIGSGMLAMPWALRVSSLISGLLLMLLVMSINGLSMVLLAKCCDLARAYHYGAIGTRALGRKGGLAIQIVMLSYTACSCLSFVTLLGDFIPSAITALRPDRFGLDESALRAYVILIIAALVLAPLSLTRTLYSLRFTSAISLGAIMFTLVMTLQKLHEHTQAHTGTDDPEPQSHVDLVMFAFPVCSWRSLAVLNCAFTAHYNTPRMYLELRQRSLPRFALVIALGMVSALAIYVATAVAGYVQFGAATQGDLLENYGVDDRMAIAARITLAVGMAFSFPLCFHAMRTSVLALVAPELVASPAESVAGAGAGAGVGAVYSARKAQCLYVGWTLGLVAVTVALGIALTRIEEVMGYKGSVFGCALAHVFPALMFLRLRRRALDVNARRRASLAGVEGRTKRLASASAQPGDLVPRSRSSCPFAWASDPEGDEGSAGAAGHAAQSAAGTAAAATGTTARSPMLSQQERAAYVHFEYESEQAEAMEQQQQRQQQQQQQQQRQHSGGGVYSLGGHDALAYAHSSPTPSPVSVVTQSTHRRASLALPTPAGSLNDGSDSSEVSLFERASRDRSASASAPIVVDSSLTLHIRDRAPSISSQHPHPHVWGSDPHGAVTLESRPALVAVWLLLAWGLALGTMGLVVNIVVQTGGLQQCA